MRTMSGDIEEVAKKWLSEPRYANVFKLTSDVFKDYLCNVLVGIGSLVLAVNFLSSMGTGPIICMLKSMINVYQIKIFNFLLGVKSANDTDKDLGPYPNGATLTMVNYANFNQKCADATLTSFMQYMGFILLVQAIIIILIEKVLIKFLRIAGKIERFYGTIVEDALFGKEPGTDIAEDVMDVKANAQAISS